MRNKFKPIPCFMYREGEHFELPEALRRLKMLPSVFAVPTDAGGLYPAPDVFVETFDPAEAVFFLFPYDIGAAVDYRLVSQVDALLESLPYFKEKRKRHVVSDMADSIVSLSSGACLFKVSVTRQGGWAERAVPLWYDVPEHVLKEKPNFDIAGANYDVSFVGAYSNVLREAAVRSIWAEAPELRFFERGEHSFKVENNAFFPARYTGRELEERRLLFVNSLRRSLTVLCPPGVGPQSVRLYETMYMGRIPVIIDCGVVYPMSEYIDYASFCLIIPHAKVMRTGSLLSAWLAGQSAAQLAGRCALAAKNWHKYLSLQVKRRNLLLEAGKKFGL